MEKKLHNEIESFQVLWKGGFKTGYSIKRNQSGIESYLKDKLKPGYCLLEIGCGGGQWSKFMVNYVDKIYCVDVLSEIHNNFWNYVGNNNRDKITYCHVKDFSLVDIPDNSLDFVFSYDVFCHISYSGQKEYLKNLKKKCKDGAILMIMYADAPKYFQNEPEHIYIQENEYKIFNNHPELIKTLIEQCDRDPVPGIWYWIGIEKFINLCQQFNYEIIEKDLNIDKTNPITLFKNSAKN